VFSDFGLLASSSWQWFGKAWRQGMGAQRFLTALAIFSCSWLWQCLWIESMMPDSWACSEGQQARSTRTWALVSFSGGLA